LIDLNHILLFVACISPLIMLGQTLRRGGLFRAWRIASFAVLLVTAAGWLIDRDTAGFVGGGAWLALLLLPALGLKKIAELASHERYDAARRWTLLLRVVHPAADLAAKARLFTAVATVQRGAHAEALAMLGALRNKQSSVARQAAAQSFRLRGEWMNLVGWVRSEVPPPVRRTDFALMALYLRALGEVGARDEMVLEFATMLSSDGRFGQPTANYQSCRFIVLAFTGRLEAHADEPGIQDMPGAFLDFWIATSEFAAGKASAARARLEKLQAGAADRLLGSEIAQRLDGGEEISRVPISPQTSALLDRIEQIDRQPVTLFGSRTMRPTMVVLILIALNLAMFAAEIRFGGSTNPFTLHRLGALEPLAIRYGQYWRMLTSLFLHFGSLHLLFNLYALFVIGPGLERIVGPLRFAVYYLLAGLGSSVGVLLWRLRDLSRPEQLVGASGCVLGIVGVWTGYLLRHRNEPHAGRRLRNIILIVVIQIAFDLSTPQISMAAHLWGFVTGIVLGLLVSAPRKLQGVSLKRHEGGV
jgi:rhomboid protease GluP